MEWLRGNKMWKNIKCFILRLKFLLHTVLSFFFTELSPMMAPHSPFLLPDNTLKIKLKLKKNNVLISVQNQESDFIFNLEKIFLKMVCPTPKTQDVNINKNCIKINKFDSPVNTENSIRPVSPLPHSKPHSHTSCTLPHTQHPKSWRPFSFTANLSLLCFINLFVQYSQ